MVMAVGTVKLFEAPNEKEKEEPVWYCCCFCGCDLKKKQINKKCFS
jgi:hypothetical protein